MYDLEASAGRSAAIKGVLDSLNTFSFFSDRKTVIVQNINKLKKAELQPISAYLGDPSTTSTLFMMYHGQLKAAQREAFSPSAIISLDMDRHELRSWTAEYAMRAGLTMQEQIVHYLMEMLGNDAGLIVSEIDKLSLLGKDRIDMKDVAGVLYGEADVDTFELTRAIASGNRKAAFKLASAFRDADSGMLLGALNWQITRNRGRIDPKKLFYNYGVLLEADTMNKSAGTRYPLEILITKLLSR